MSKRLPTALVVEDDLEIRALVCEALAGDGWHVLQAGAIADAGLHLHLPLPDLIVLDLGLPHGDCVACIAAIRQRSHVPIIVMAARVDASEKMRALAAGANDYVSKLFCIGARFTGLLQRFRPHPTGEYQ